MTNKVCPTGTESIKDKCVPTEKNILISIKKLEKVFVELGFDPLRGDCGNFAVALQDILGEGKYVAAYETEGFAEDGKPAHVALKIGNKLFDATGRITKKDLELSAFNEAFPEDNNIVIEENDSPLIFREIYNEDKVQKAKNRRLIV